MMHIERTPRTLHWNGIAIKVAQLDLPLYFFRKLRAPESGDDGVERLTTVYVAETRVLTAGQFDDLANNFLASRDWLAGKGGAIHNGFLCIEVLAPGRPRLYINPDGMDYCRYVAAIFM